MHSKVREVTQRRKAEKLQVGLETAYCAETVAITYEEMGLLTSEKHYNWFDPGSFWSGDSLPLAPGYRLGDEIAVVSRLIGGQRRAKQGFASSLGIDAFWLENVPTTPVSVTLTLSAWMPSG